MNEAKYKELQEQTKKLKKDLNLTDDEARTLNLFLNKYLCYKKRSPNYYNIRQFSDKYKKDFDFVNNLYNLWLDNEAKKLNKPKLKGLLIHQHKGDKLNRNYINIIDFIGDLEHYYKLLNCNLIDIQERKIKNKIYDFIFDEEFLSKEPTYKNISALSKDRKEIIFNNLLIVGKANFRGEETPLNTADINTIKQSLVIFKTDDFENLVLQYDF